MTDALKKRQPEDKRVIGLSDTWEVEYWTKTLDVSVEQLRTAVANVGKDSQKVKQFLGK